VAFLGQLVRDLERENPLVTRSRSSRIVLKWSITSAWLMMSSSLRPCHSNSATWLNGSRRAPNFDAVRPDPLGHRPHLPVVFGHQDDDPVGLASR